MVSKWGCVGWLKKRTNMEKTLLSLSSLLLLTLVIMILVSAISHGKTSDDSEVEEKCWTSECIQTAGEIISSMDPAVDSCVDFYGFSCGRFGLQQTSAADKKATDSMFFALKNILESSEELDVPGLEDLRSFYDSCVQFGRYRPSAGAIGKSLLALMSEMGIKVWPILDPGYDTSGHDTASTLASLALLGVPVIFRVEVVPDSLLPDSYLLKISPGGPREIGRSVEEIRTDGRLHSSVLTSLLLLGTTSASSDTYVTDILNVDSMIAAFDRNTSCDGIDVLAPSEAISGLAKLVPEVEKWKNAFDTIRNVTGLQYKFAVELHCKRKIRVFARLMKDITLRSETNYLGWRFFSEFLEHVIPTFEKSSFGDSEEDVPRWRSCLDLMQKFATPLLTEVFTRKMIGEQVQSEVDRIVQSVVASSQHLVSRARWLSEPQRQKIRQKMNRLPVRYPFLKNGLSKQMPISIPQVDVSNFTAVVVQLQRQRVMQHFKRLNLENFKESWAPLLSSKGSAVPADHIPVFLDKVVPPYLRFQGPEWINFGGFGAFVAREISKLLITMNAGSSQDENEIVWNLWIRNEDVSSCLVRSFVSRLDLDSEQLPPEWMESMMKEIFLHRSSLEIAYESARSTTARPSKSGILPGLDFSQEKMLFLAHAQTLCDIPTPSEAQRNSSHLKERFNSAVSSFNAFNEVYGCPTSSSRCPSIWQ